MKKIVTVIAGLIFGLMINAQEVASAQPGVVYGNYSKKGKIVTADQLESKITDKNYEGKVQGKVVEDCKAMGCWAKLERADGSTIMIKVKDHEFAMPEDIVGKIIVADGKAEIKETSVSMLKHYAEDAGKSDEEIAKIKEPRKEVLMTIKGVKVVE